MKNKIFKIIFLLVVLFLIVIFSDDIYNFLLTFKNSFFRTVIDEQRYKLLLNGLCATLIISICSIIIGIILGLIIFFARKSKSKMLSKILKFFVNFIQGVPVTVLLLTFYYVIFGKVNIEPIIVAIITFSLYFSAYASEVFRGAREAINNSQIQSAYALGFNKKQTFIYIVFPQVLSYIIPILKNEIVSLIKLTSIAGYISIMDLTKASDIIRNRTYEAFFPLIITATIYFLICYIISKLLDLLYIKVNSRKFLQEDKKC